eukprot:m.100812 g.100812  ORF g.100812 m.100812 type:complete len:152 (+) comp8946_c0_seq3:160-615(+)
MAAPTATVEVEGTPFRVEDEDAGATEIVPRGPQEETIDVGSLMGPIASQLTMGTVSGACAGYAAKRISRAAAVTVGTVFLGLQALAYAGYIDIHWDRVQAHVVHHLDHDQDGKVGRNDLQTTMNKAMKAMQYNLPSSSGFAVGFLGGFALG